MIFVACVNHATFHEDESKVGFSTVGCRSLVTRKLGYIIVKADRGCSRKMNMFP